MDIVTWYYRVDPRRIVLLKSMLEGYEGLVVVRREPDVQPSTARPDIKRTNE